MEDDKRNDSVNGGNIEGAGRWDRRDCEEDDDMSSSSVGSSGEVVGSAPRSVANTRNSGESGGSRNMISLADRLADSLLGGDCDLLLQQSERENNFLQWLQALDMQAIGACRADERMKPLLKANASAVAEDRILTYLSEHFEAAEVGLLARCLCIPLVSVRVGKIIKHGTTLCPTSSR